MCKKLLSVLFEKDLAVEKLVVTKLVHIKSSCIDLIKQLSGFFFSLDLILLLKFEKLILLPY